MNGLYMAASGAASQLAGIDIAASNLANAGTAGFRRILNVVESLTGNDSPYEYASTPASPMVDMSQGPLKATGNPLDIAVSGPAFIVVETPDGPAYTRNGELQVAPDGTLTAANYPVAREGGGSIVLPQGAITVADDGSIAVNGAPQGKIALADPSGQELIPLGAGLYRQTGPDPLPPAAAGSHVHQGFLESSGTSSVNDLVSMMGVMRNYESAMKAISTIDQNENQAIQTYTIQS